MILRMTYLHKHNLFIDWVKGTWHFDRCLDHCNSRAANQISTEEILKLTLNGEALKDLNIKDTPIEGKNSFIFWIKHEEPKPPLFRHVQTMLEKNDKEDKNMANWQKQVLKHYHEYRKVFF